MLEMPTIKISKTATGRPTAKCIRGLITTLILTVIVIQFSIALRFANKNTATSKPSPTVPTIDFTLWSKEQTYMRDCELHYKRNETWGKIHAQYVDKIEAKNIIERMEIPHLKIIPTYAILDKTNISTMYHLQFLQGLKQPFIMKSTHMSGGVARFYNDKYHCFKYCDDNIWKLPNMLPLGPDAVRASRSQWKRDLNDDYSGYGGELQYKFITPRIIIEEDIISGGKTNTDVTFWWLSNGHPVVVSQQCERPKGNKAQGFQMNRVFVGTDYRRLPIVFNRGTCEKLPPRPESWDKQLRIMQYLGRHFPREVVRIDVYAGGDEVWFSEFTFTTAGCWRRFTPAVADGLLYGLMKGGISPDVVTPASIERLLTDDSWVLVSLDNRTLSGSHPSPVDLCSTIERFSDKVRVKEILFHSCIRKLRPIRKFSLRCIVSQKNGTSLHSFGVNEPVKGTSNVDHCAAKYADSKIKSS